MEPRLAEMPGRTESVPSSHHGRPRQSRSVVATSSRVPLLPDAHPQRRADYRRISGLESVSLCAAAIELIREVVTLDEHEARRCVSLGNIGWQILDGQTSKG